MEKLCLLLAFAAFWIVPSPAVPAHAGGLLGLQQILPNPAEPPQKAGALGNGVTQWTTVEINGVLEFEDGALRPHIPEFGAWMGFGITADGKWFGLDLGEGKDRLDFAERIELAKKLVGKRVLVRGKVEERTLDGLIKQQIKVVVVSDLQEVDTRESITLQLTGVFHVDAPITYLQNAPVITVDGQMYFIDYEGAEGIFAEAKKLDGKRVALTGRLMGTNMYSVFCRPETMNLPVVLPKKIVAADENTLDGVQVTIQGKLKRLSEVPANSESFVPRWSIRASGREYRLNFGNRKLTELAEKLDGKVV
ncbi:MAG TPA: hypothetical protein VGG61_07820, partial [Gemmataceae bacterium]